MAIWVIFDIIAVSVGIFAIPVYVSAQNGVNSGYVKDVDNWSFEFWNSLYEMWKVTPSRPVYMMIAQGNFGPEMGFTVSYPDSFRVLVDVEFPMSEMRGVVAHELMHVFQFAWIRQNQKPMPLWVMEGLATWYGGKMGTYSSSLGSNPFLFWNVNVLKYEKYPVGQQALEEYYGEVYSLFNTINAKADLEKNFQVLLSDVKKTGSWEDALSMVMGENFDTFYSNWRKNGLLSVSLTFMSFWGIWIGLPILLALIVIVRQIRRFKPIEDRQTADDLDGLEEIYGKEYWKDEDGQ